MQQKLEFMKSKTLYHTLEVRNLTKRYQLYPALDSISFEANSAEIIGLIGANGAGKTTLLRILATLLNPTMGEIYIKKYNLKTDFLEIRRLIGYMPEEGGLYLKFNSTMILQFYASFYHQCHEVNKDINYFLDIFDLVPMKNQQIGKFSKGMRQKLLFIRAILHNPDLILLDEPFIAMDPETKFKIKQILLDKKQEGKTILFSSHTLTDVEDLCDRIIVLKNAKIILDQNLLKLFNDDKHKDMNTLEEIYLKLME